MNAVHTIVAGALTIAAGLYPSLGMPIPNGLELLRLVASVAIGAGYFTGRDAVIMLSTPSWRRVGLVIAAAAAACVFGWTYLAIAASLGAGRLVAMFLILSSFLTFFPMGVVAGALTLSEPNPDV